MNSPFSLLRSKYVCRDNGLFLASIGFGRYQLGIQLHPWGLRIMLIWWHVFVHWPEKPKKTQTDKINKILNDSMVYWGLPSRVDIDSRSAEELERVKKDAT